MNPFRSVGARLSLALAVVVLGALAVVWVALVPTLERRLVAGRLSELAGSARGVLRESEAARTLPNQDFVDEAARSAVARVVYYRPLALGTISPIFDSAHLLSSRDVERDPIALKAAADPGVQRGRVSRGGNDYAEAAVADSAGDVLLFSAPLHATLEDVDLVQSPPAISTNRSKIGAGTSSASWLLPSIGCACASPASTMPDESSSPTPHTSSARRFSRSAAFSSSSATRSSTRPPDASSSRR